MTQSSHLTTLAVPSEAPAKAGPRAIPSRLALTAAWREAIVASALCALVVLGVYHQLAFSDGIPFGYDLFNYFYPHLAYAGDRLRAGEVPLWNPFLFTGVPFAANIQTAIFYPTTWLALWLEPPDVVRYAALIHFWLAAIAGYAFLRLQVQVGPIAAFFGTLCFALGGFVSSQFGHPNQLAAAAWLPIVLLAAGRLMAGSTPAWAAALGAAIALQFLAGHTQEFYFSMVLLAAYCTVSLLIRLGTGTIEGVRLNLATLAQNAGLVVRSGMALVLSGVIAGLLMAPQLLPTLELSGLSIRGGGLSYEEASSFSWPPTQILRGILSPFGESPYGEYIGYVGIIGLAFALYGVLQARRRWPAGFFTIAALAAVSLAMGGYNPFFGDLLGLVPGLGLFRVPSRWLFVAGFSVSMLAGIGMDAALLTVDRSRAATLRRGAPAVALLIIVVGGIALLWPFQSLPSTGVIAAWAVVGVVGIAAIAAAIAGRLSNGIAVVLVGLSLAELFMAGIDLDGRRLTAPDAYDSLRPVPLQLSLDPGVFRTLTISLAEYQPGDAQDLRALLGDITTPARIDDLLIAHKYKDLLVPNQGLRFGIPSLDGYDGGVLPLRRFVEFKHAILESGGLRYRNGKEADPTQPDGLLREQLGGVPSPAMLGMLNVKYVIMDRTDDIWLDGAYIDAAIGAAIAPGSSLQVPTPDTPATELLLAFQRVTPAAPGAPRPKVLLRTWREDGQETVITLGAPAPDTEVTFDDIPSHSYLTLARVRLTGSDRLRAFQVTVPSGYPLMTLSGATLFDRRSGSNQPIAVDPRFEIVYLGDLKVYRNLGFLERAFVAYNYELAPDLTDVIYGLRARVDRRVLLDRSPGFASPSTEYPFQSATIESYRPEAIRIRATAERDGILVLSDGVYPGWRATIDGRDAPILTVNYDLRGVRLRPGMHEVEFTYDPQSFWLGADLAVAGIAGLLTTLVASALVNRAARRR